MNKLIPEELTQSRLAIVKRYTTAMDNHIANIKNSVERGYWCNMVKANGTVITKYTHKDLTVSMILDRPIECIKKGRPLSWTLKLEYKGETISAANYTILNTSNSPLWNRILHINKSFGRLSRIAITNLMHSDDICVVDPELTAQLNTICFRASGALAGGVFSLYTDDASLYMSNF